MPSSLKILMVHLLQLILNIRADIPEENFATSVVVVIPVIRATNGVR